MKFIPVVTALVFTGACFGEVFPTAINGEAMASKTVIISIDDFAYEKWQGVLFGTQSWTLEIAKYLKSVKRVSERGQIEIGVPVVWFLTGCHIQGQPPSDPRSGMCMPYNQ